MKTRRIVCMIVCHSGELELKSILLAASIRYFLGANVTIRFAIPDIDTEIEKLHLVTLSLIDDLQIEVIGIKNTIDEAYKIGNKVEASAMVSDGEELLILDSDMLVIKKFDLYKVFETGFIAKPADFSTFTKGNEDLWKQVYDLFDLPLPAQNVVSTVDNKEMKPYFNAGVIYCSNIKFGSQRIDACKKIDASSIENKRPRLDQIALPISVIQTGLQYHLLDVEYNFPAHVMNPDKQQVFLCHYHTPEVINGSRKLRETVLSLIDHYPKIDELIIKYNWNNILILDPHRISKLWTFLFRFFSR